MKKAVFFDIDGTLWDHRMRVPESTVKAIHKLRENGQYAFLCSGRSRAAIQAKELLEDIGFDGILAGCGTYIEWEGRAVYERNLSNEELKQLFRTLREHHVQIVLEGKQYLYADLAEFGHNPYILNFKKVLGDGFAPLCARTEEYDVNKLTGYFTGENAEEMKRELSGQYELLFHTPQVFELLPKGFSKASGIQWICDYLHIAHEDTYAFGDSVNDLEMLRYVKHGIAMGNASKAVKEASDYVTSDLREDGIFNGLKHFSLI